MTLNQPLSLLDLLALRTLTVGVALLGGDSIVTCKVGADTDNAHSSQFEYLLEDKGDVPPLKLASDIYRLAGRSNFAAPGFALLRQERIKSSREHRKSLVELKENLSQVHEAVAGQKLGWFSLGRFDQRTGSKPHRDGGPPQSLLLLGYEPSKMKSDLWIADYSACAHLLGFSPVQLLEEFNPMYTKGLQHLAPYTMPILEFDPSVYNILVVNNSCAPLSKLDRNWQGVLHWAQIYGKTLSPRIINSASITPINHGDKENVSTTALEQFLNDDRINE